MKYYHRENGEVVITENFEPKSSRYEEAINDWCEYIASLPVTHYCSPDEPVGFLEGYGEIYQENHFHMGWVESNKRTYDALGEVSPEDRRIYLTKQPADYIKPSLPEFEPVDKS